MQQEIHAIAGEIVSVSPSAKKGGSTQVKAGSSINKEQVLIQVLKQKLKLMI